MPVEYAPDRMGNFRRGQSSRGYLVKKLLKEVMILPIDHENVDWFSMECFGALDPGESSAENNHFGFCHENLKIELGKKETAHLPGRVRSVGIDFPPKRFRPRSFSPDIHDRMKNRMGTKISSNSSNGLFPDTDTRTFEEFFVSVTVPPDVCFPPLSLSFHRLRDDSAPGR
ncbi:MAG: hypothetical protein P1U81_17965 [Verrucomicrobiales bacterium]|nr:hypothetical protein [Verrucomicrobiales bacterium]